MDLALGQCERGTLPAGWFCASEALIRTLSPDCAVQPMMTLDYDVARLGLGGAAPAGRQVLGLTVGHIQLADNAKIAGAGVGVSFDGGKTWRRASVTRTGPGRFRAVFSAPAGALVTLRTTATDAAGGSITETITGAYRIAAPAGRAPRAARVLRPAAPAPRPATSALRAACPSAPRGGARCFALFAPQSGVNAAIAAGVNGAAAVPAGWGATDIESVYKLPVSRDPNQTVAVVDAYQTPDLAADLAVYRRQYGLPSRPSALPSGDGVQVAVMQGIPAGPWPYPKGSGHTAVEVGLVYASPQCTGS